MDVLAPAFQFLATRVLHHKSRVLTILLCDWSTLEEARWLSTTMGVEGNLCAANSATMSHLRVARYIQSDRDATETKRAAATTWSRGLCLLPLPSQPSLLASPRPTQFPSLRSSRLSHPQERPHTRVADPLPSPLASLLSSPRCFPVDSPRPTTFGVPFTTSLTRVTRCETLLCAASMLARARR